MGPFLTGLEVRLLGVFLVYRARFYAAVLPDPVVGGTYLTLLQTAANMGGSWPGSVALLLQGTIESLLGVSAVFTLSALLVLQAFARHAPQLQRQEEVAWHVDLIPK